MSMEKIRDIWVTEKMYNMAVAATGEGAQIFLSAPGTDGLEANAIVECANCGGTGQLVLSVKGKVPWMDAKTARFGDIFVTDLTFPCPMCNEVDYADIRIGLLANSGLVMEEYDGEIGFLRAFDGKENALKVAGKTLSMFPETRGIILFFGDNGSGKTGLLKAMVASACRVGVPARYVTMASYLDEMRNSFDEHGSDVFQSYMRFSVLAIDEIDRHSGTRWAESESFRLIDERYARRHSFLTLMASNLNPDALQAIYPEIQSRLLDGIMCPLFGEIRGKQ